MSIAYVRDSDDYNQNTGGAGTYYIAVGSGADESRVMAIHMKWDAVLAATITLEAANFPEVTLSSATAGDWVAVAGFTASPATAASGAVFNVLDRGERKYRLKVVVTAGGVLRVRSHGKP